MKLNETELKNKLQELHSDWSIQEGALHREFVFENFVHAFSFMSAIALSAEKIDHHPHWSNVYNTVIINLNTHDVGSITDKDFTLAKYADGVYKK